MNETLSYKCKVSSTINRDVKNFGKQFMFDGNDETCWNSDEGKTQWIIISYDKPIKFSNIGIQFQGGFAAECAQLELLNNGSILNTETLDFQNNNSFQNIKLSQCYTSQNIKLQFDKICDTYGRIIVYHLLLNELY